MLENLSRASISILLFTLPGCQQFEQPREVAVEFPDLIASGDPVRAIVRITKNDGTRTESEGKHHELAVEPADLARLDPPAALRCLRTGDGKVYVKIGTVASSRPLRCRLVSRIEAPPLGRLIMDSGPLDPKLRVLDKAGRELNDVPLSLTSSANSVVQARGAVLLPLKVGTASVRAHAGAVTEEIKVEVARKLNPEALPIDDNRRIHFSLDAGKYELSVRLPSPHKLNVEWRGAPYCGSSSTGTEHTSTCTLQGKGGVVFDNPGFLKDGTKTVSTEGVSLHEIP